MIYWFTEAKLLRKNHLKDNICYVGEMLVTILTLF